MSVDCHWPAPATWWPAARTQPLPRSFPHQDQRSANLCCPTPQTLVPTCRVASNSTSTSYQSPNTVYSSNRRPSHTCCTRLSPHTDSTTPTSYTRRPLQKCEHNRTVKSRVRRIAKPDKANFQHCFINTVAQESLAGRETGDGIGLPNATHRCDGRSFDRTC